MWSPCQCETKSTEISERSIPSRAALLNHTSPKATDVERDRGGVLPSAPLGDQREAVAGRRRGLRSAVRPHGAGVDVMGQRGGSTHGRKVRGERIDQRLMGGGQVGL